MEGAITPIRYRSNRQTLEKFKSFPTGISQEEIMKETKDFFGVIKSNKKQFIKNQIEDFITEQKTLKQSIKRQIMKEKNGQGKFFVDPPEDFIPKKVSSYKIIETAGSKNNFCTKCQEILVVIVFLKTT